MSSGRIGLAGTLNLLDLSFGLAGQVGFTQFKQAGGSRPQPLGGPLRLPGGGIVQRLSLQAVSHHAFDEIHHPAIHRRSRAFGKVQHDIHGGPLLQQTAAGQIIDHIHLKNPVSTRRTGRHQQFGQQRLPGALVNITQQHLHIVGADRTAVQAADQRPHPPDAARLDALHQTHGQARMCNHRTLQRAQ